MSARNEDFLFAQEAQRRGYVGEGQIEEAFRLQRRMAEELQLDERLAVILVKRGWIAEDQARRVQASIEPKGAGEQIAGYQILEKLGVGAMGTVYKAIHRGLQRPVAIKVLRRELAQDDTQIERLKEEAKILASLDHPNIVRALDAGESNGFPFVVMEYVEGETLKDVIARDGPLEEGRALEITRKLADALERARRMGVVHRDVKPGNVILSRQGEPKLMDLGLAKGPVDLGLTQHGATVGTPQYISPEQAQDPRRADTRSDIYSLGATLYAMLTAKPPHSGATLAEILTKVLYEAPTPPRIANRRISAEAGYLVERMMLKDASLRYRTPREVVRDIDEILAGRSIVPSGFTGNWEAFLLRKRIRFWTKVGSIGLAATILIAVAITWGIRRSERLAALEAGGKAVAEALASSQVRPTDDRAALMEKRARVEGVLDRWREVHPDGFDALDVHARLLGRELGYLDRALALEEESRGLRRRHRYDVVQDRIDQLVEAIPGVDSPAERRLQTLRGTIQLESEAERLRRREAALTTNVESLDALLEQQRAYAEALREGLLARPALERDRELAAQAIRTLASIVDSAERLEAQLSPEALAPRLETLDLRGIRQDIERGRRGVLATAALAWSKLEAAGWLPTRTVTGLLERRIDRVEEELDALVAARWAAIEDRAIALQEAGRTPDAVATMRAFERAAGEGSWPTLAGEAGRRADALAEAWARTMAEAEATYLALQADVLAHLRRGDPAAARARIAEGRRQVDARWPYLEDIDRLRTLADAYEGLQRAAFAAVRRADRLEEVALADGVVERRWIVRDAHPDELSLTVEIRGRRERRGMDDVAPGQLVRWVEGADDGARLDAATRAAVRLAALPTKEPHDLRDLLGAYAAAHAALEEAGLDGALATWLAGRHAAWVEGQEAREDTAAENLTSARYYFAQGDYTSAFHHLEELLREGGVLRATDVFEQSRAEIEQLRAKIADVLANRKLSEKLHGARIDTVMEDGEERTSVLIDFDSPVQLEIFRRDRGRACGVLEPFARAPVTPDSPTNHRFHLLRGMEGLIRDRPLSVPCVFDPAAPISVAFTIDVGEAPFFLAVDVDGLMVGVLSADPAMAPYAARWSLPSGLPPLDKGEEAPVAAWYGRGRGVAFHDGPGLGNPATWSWPLASRATTAAEWAEMPRSGETFGFEAERRYRVRVVRDGGRITLFVDDEEIASAAEQAWAERGFTSDRNRGIRGGTGLIQIQTWTPAAIDDLRMTGAILERWRQ